MPSPKAYELRETIDRPDGFVLEAPFNSMKAEGGTFWLAKVFKHILDVDKLIEDSDLEFNSELWIKSLKEPVFILHAKDDNVINFELGKRLFQVALEHSVRVKFFPFEKNLRLRHDDIYKADSFNVIIDEITSVIRDH